MRSILPFAAILALTACADPNLVARSAPPGEFVPGRTAPEDAAPGTCWDKTETPAVIQTVTEDVLVQPAQISDTGTIQSPPVYRSESRQQIVQERHITWFQTLCPADLTPEFMTSVQRALQIRGYYAGPETGQLDPATRDALSRFQAQEDIHIPDPGSLSVETAQRMGLWVVERPT